MALQFAMKRCLLQGKSAHLCRRISVVTATNQRNLSSQKVYELRTYSIKPSLMKPFLDLTNEKIHLRMNFSVLHGYWTVELGGINQVFHLWEYGN